MWFDLVLFIDHCIKRHFYLSQTLNFSTRWPRLVLLFLTATRDQKKQNLICCGKNQWFPFIGKDWLLFQSDSFCANFRNALISSARLVSLSLEGVVWLLQKFCRDGRKNPACFHGLANNPVCICRWGNLQFMNRISNMVYRLLISRCLPSGQPSLTAS